jgi:hypothetical protein
MLQGKLTNMLPLGFPMTALDRWGLRLGPPFHFVSKGADFMTAVTYRTGLGRPGFELSVMLIVLIG